MLISKNYVLSNEVAKKGNMHIANFSMFSKLCEDTYIKGAIEKFGNCTFINSRSIDVPNNFRKVIQTEKMTDLTNCGLISYLTKYFETSKKDLVNLPTIKRVFDVEGKQFVEFTEEFADILRTKVVTNITHKDYIDCKIGNNIEGGLMLTKNNYIVWY